MKRPSILDVDGAMKRPSILDFATNFASLTIFASADFKSPFRQFHSKQIFWMMKVRQLLAPFLGLALFSPQVVTSTREHDHNNDFHDRMIAETSLRGGKNHHHVVTLPNGSKVSLFEGDILLTESQAIARFGQKEANKMQDNGFLFLLDDKAEEMRDASSSRQLGTVASSAQRLWPDPTNIPYWFANDFTSDDRDAVMSALDHIASSGVVAFSEISDCSQPPARSYIEYTAQAAGCFSPVGLIPGKPTTVNLGPRCTTSQYNIIHETLHALGFFHEQDRPDRDDHVVIHFENIREINSHLFSKRASSEVNTYGLPYDLNSIMHFGERSFSANNMNTITTVDPDLQNLLAVPTRTMSSLDHETLRRMYGLNPQTPSPVAPTPSPVAPTHSPVTTFQSSKDFSVAFGFYGIEIKEIASDADQFVLPLPASYVSSPGKFRWRSVAGVDQDNIKYRGSWNRETGGIALNIDVADQFKAFGVTVTDVWPTGADAGMTAATLEDVKGFFSFNGLSNQDLIYLPASISTVNLKAVINGVTGPGQVIALNDTGLTNADEYFEKVQLTNFPAHTNGGTVEVQGIKEDPGFSDGDMFWLPDGTKKLFKYRAVANRYTGIWNGFRAVAENGGGDDSTIVTNGELDLSNAFQAVTIQNLQPNVAVEIKSNNETTVITGDADNGAEQVFDMPTRIYRWRVVVNEKGGAFKDNVVAAGTDWTIDASSFFCPVLAYLNEGEKCPASLFYDTP